MFKISINSLRLGFYDLEDEQLKVVSKLCELTPFRDKYYFYGTKEEMFDVLVALSKDFDIELV